MKKYLSLLLALLLILSSTVAFTQGNEVSDYETHWAKKEIDYMKEKKILSGYPDGTFRPDNNMTKAEFYRIINGLIGYSEKAKITFDDVKEIDWFYEEVQKAVKAGYIKQSQCLNPNNYITREEVAEILGIVFNIEEDIEVAREFKDFHLIPENLRGIFGGLKKQGYIVGYPDGTFRPKSNITRAEVVKMLHNITGEIVNEAGAYTKKRKY